MSTPSVLAPQGEAAEAIATLAWVLFAFGAFVFAVVVAALLVALYGTRTGRSRISSDKFVLWAGLAFPVVSLTLLLAGGIWLTGSLLRLGDRAEIAIEVAGEQWWWRIAYKGPRGERVESANELRLPVGVPVRLVLTSNDVIHSFWVPALAGKLDLVPGRTNTLAVQASSPGTFRGQCAEFCGGPHALMALSVVAMAPADYADWLAREAGAATMPESEAARRGAALFQSAGCGACHRIRGTEAAGAIGPDLTHLAGRSTLGAHLLPLTPENLQRFVANNQAIKPGNRMPEFRLFDAGDAAALAAYLAGLR